MSYLSKLIAQKFVKPSAKRAPVDVKDILAANQSYVRLTLPPPTPAGKTRIHLFVGTFSSEQAAWHYCYRKKDGQPEALRRDLPHAPLNTDFVEVCFGTVARRLQTFLAPIDVARILDDMDGANTLVIIAEPAFCGLAYALQDTPRLRFLGPMVVNAKLTALN